MNFKQFGLRRDALFFTDHPQKVEQFWLSTGGKFSPALSLTSPIKKDGSLTKYARLLLDTYYDRTISTKDALKSISSLSWQTLRYSGLLYKVDNGIYILTKNGTEYCERLMNEFCKKNYKK